MRHILFGDSIGFGVGDYHSGGWASQLRLFIDQQKHSKDHNFINLSISGDTTRGLLARMEREARLRMRNNPPEDFIFLIAIGTNDSKVDKTNPEKNVKPDEFSSNLRELIRQAQLLSKEVILIGLLPVDEQRTTPYKENSHYLVSRLEMYNEIIATIAAEKQLRFVNFFPSWKEMKLPDLFADGLHPNEIAHKLLFETIRDQLFTVE